MGTLAGKKVKCLYRSTAESGFAWKITMNTFVNCSLSLSWPIAALVRPTTEPKLITCRCTSCRARPQCITDGACVVDINATSLQANYYCVYRTPGLWLSTICRAKVGRSLSNKTFTTALGEHRFCCVADMCNKAHPKWQDGQ